MRTDVERATLASGLRVRRLAGLYHKLATRLSVNHAPVDGLNENSVVSGPGECTGTLDRRGTAHRAKRKMPDEEAQAFLKEQRVVHVGTKDANGWPYVIPLVYVYEGGDLFYFHTGDHRGHFESNIRHDPRVCVEVSKIGAVHTGEPYACNSSLEYTSVIMFGTVRLIEDCKMKEWFFDRLLAKYGEPGWTFKPGYPLLDQIVLYELEIEVFMGKNSHGLGHQAGAC